MAIYANEDGTISDLTGEYLAVDSGLTGIKAFTKSTTITLDSKPKFVLCFYTYNKLISGTAGGLEYHSYLGYSVNLSGHWVGKFDSNGSIPNSYLYTYNYIESTKQLVISINNGHAGTNQTSEDRKYEDCLMIVFY